MSAHQKKHPFDFKTQYGLGLNQQDDEIVVDFFCGGGGAGTGLEMGLGRAVTVAKNHSPAAISMHTVNHPHAKHFTIDVFEGDPDTECGGRAVGWFHMSPDCTHHSQAAGGQPRKREIRNLSWIGLKWAGKKLPRVISLENVKQILQWGPLVAKRCKSTGRVIKLGGGIAGPGEVVSVNEQFLVPDPKRRGQTWVVFVAELQRLGYAVEWRVIKACDFGAPTSRERLFMIARCDGQPIVWPEPTHAKNPTKGQQKWRTAAECIDWSIPSKSIFGRKKDLAPATLRRVAKGMRKFVLDAANPFIVPIANWSGESVQSAAEPLRTVTSYPKGGAFSVVSPVMVAAAHGEGKPGGVQRWGAGSRSTGEPLGTVTASGGHSIAAAHLVKFRFADEGKALDEPLPTIISGGNYKRPAGATHAMGISTVFMAQMNGGFNTTAAKSIEDPMTTVTNTGSQQQLVTANLVHLRGNCDARDLNNPLHTISAGGTHHGLMTAFMERQFGASVGLGLEEPAPTITAGGGGKSSLVELQLSPEVESGALRVAAFLISYYGTSDAGDIAAPAPTITTRDRLALVTVTIKGTPYVIVDICLRMLQPAELYKAQGFPTDYIISHGADGKPFTKTQQVHMCGNSVSPPPMAALARANDPWRAIERQAVAA
ncbi:DNA cytosine methyltransferase [Pseudomonas helleri]|uniref:DNA (cytosine-5-)-methyltransferase n=1 Tax=Pseudomonas helleri TaxID=1608996 RepID=A0A7X1XYD6_9PSED|nr:DNA cytosine methyltransferase [Pseudomonas helleri]MQU27235.1 DNA cytosine methyltransferase [Pseudomonas helleri]